MGNIKELRTSVFNLVDTVLKFDSIKKISLELEEYNIDNYDFLEIGEFLKSIGDVIIKESIKGNLEV